MTSSNTRTANGRKIRKLFSGWLEKRGGLRKNWKQRYFVLLDNKELQYYEDDQKEDLKGTIELTSVSKFGAETDASRTDGRSDCISLTCADRVWVFSCKNKVEQSRWLHLLEKVIIGLKIHSGWLTKRGGVRKNWNQRYFVVRDNRSLSYYEAEDCENLIGCIDLGTVLRLEPGDTSSEERPFTLNMVTDDRTWIFSADSEEQQEQWIHVLERAIGGAKRLVTSKEGWLTKQGAVRKNWKKRYFVLSRGWVFYFAEYADCRMFKSIAFFSEKMFNQAFVKYVRGSVPLQDAKIQSEPSMEGNDNVFSISTPSRTFFISAANQEDKNSWLTAVSDGGLNPTLSWDPATMPAHRRSSSTVLP